MAIKNLQLTTNELDLLEVPANKSYAITNILVCNTSTTNSAFFTMHLIPDTNAKQIKVTSVVRELELPAGETFTFDSERIVLEAGDRITFEAGPDIGADLTDLAATVSYLEV